jgi:acyl-CoA oxidase
MTEREPLNSKGLMNADGVVWGYEEYLKPLIYGQAGPFKGSGTSKL